MPASEVTGKRFAPSTAAVSLRTKLAYDIALLRDHWGRFTNPESFDWLFDDIEEYDKLLQRHASIPLEEARILEIGYGARPYRLMALQSRAATAPGMTVSGVDAEVPILDASAEEWRAALRANGVERALKSLVRYALFDRAERARFDKALSRRGLTRRTDQRRFLVQDATTLEMPPRSLDMVVSEDVFEHIPARALERLVRRIATWLVPPGLALVRPNIFTGITGGHEVEWNRRSFTLRGGVRKTPPWGHLRGWPDGANTYLNRLSRSDYRALFERYFEILDEQVKIPGLGHEHLTADAAAELSDWPEDELFSNQVLFVLSPRRL